MRWSVQHQQPLHPHIIVAMKRHLPAPACNSHGSQLHAACVPAAAADTRDDGTISGRLKGRACFADNAFTGSSKSAEQFSTNALAASKCVCFALGACQLMAITLRSSVISE